ncbi:hypothetical protein IKG13_04355 [Candidatus Saccharibacteria bacterium]|nr:hypothetical protein [Candidatus Saccharibacteria bacterium]
MFGFSNYGICAGCGSNGEMLNNNNLCKKCAGTGSNNPAPTYGICKVCRQPKFDINVDGVCATCNSNKHKGIFQ